ncbi:MAG TPA: NAD(P)H-dependent oxidoreductase [Candidatus Saccharimonadales bacterium]|nr:NAD(P)H-dependent oxidoreductase [Candidatus Saccharimonadales bacterium]
MAKKIQLIIGSTRQNRLAPQFAAWIEAQAAQNSDIELEVVDLKEWNLPFMDSPVPPAYGPVDTPEAKAWTAKLAEAEGFIFLSAEYNRSVPAPLKNALDYTVAEWKEKPAIIATYGYIDGGASASRHLEDIFAWLKVAVVDTKVNMLIQKDWLDENGAVTNLAAHLDETNTETMQKALTELAA